MIRYNEYFLYTKIDNLYKFEADKYSGLIEAHIESNYGWLDTENNNVALGQKLELNRLICMLDNKCLWFMNLLELKHGASGFSQLKYGVYTGYELNDAGKEYYDLLCMMLSNEEADDTWITNDKINEFIHQYCLY